HRHHLHRVGSLGGCRRGYRRLLGGGVVHAEHLRLLIPDPGPRGCNLSRPMNTLKGIVNDLRQRRLWPVALALVVALVAVPVLLFPTGKSAPLPRPPPPRGAPAPATPRPPPPPHGAPPPP